MQLHWKVLLASVLVTLAVIIGVGSVSGDTNDPPTTEVLVTQPPIASRWQPGQLYPTGSSALWERQHLTLAEQDLLDKQDPTMPGTANARYQEAAAYHGSRAAAGLAAARLGLVGVEEIGVVP